MDTYIPNQYECLLVSREEVDVHVDPCNGDVMITHKEVDAIVTVYTLNGKDATKEEVWRCLKAIGYYPSVYYLKDFYITS